MLHEEKKAAKIVEELTMFFFGLGATKMTSEITRKENVMYISFESDYAQEKAYKIDSMEAFLKDQKNDGIEDIYWELAGTGEPGETSELLLIGMMVDSAKVIKHHGYVTIELEKKLPY